MNAIWIWGAAVLLYAAFYLWYNGLRRPLTPQEIDAYMKRLQESAVETTPGPALRRLRR